MPAKSQAQQRLFGAAANGADFPLARKIRATMSRKTMRDFAATKHQHLPDRIKAPKIKSPGAAAKQFLKAPTSTMGHLYRQRLYTPARKRR